MRVDAAKGESLPPGDALPSCHRLLLNRFLPLRSCFVPGCGPRQPIHAAWLPKLDFGLGVLAELMQSSF